MSRKQSQEHILDDWDDLDSPTEPMAQIILAPYAASTIPMAESLPAPVPDERPFPQASPLPPSRGWQALPETPAVYPVLPPAPNIHPHGRPAGSAPPVRPGNQWQGPVLEPRRSPVPVFVGIFFVVVQLVLLLRVVLMLLAVSNSIPWVGFIYGTGAVFALPFRLVLDQISWPVFVGSDLLNYLASLLAILIYGLVSRILVRFLKALLNSR